MADRARPAKDDRLTLTFYASVMGVVFLLAALLPLAFRTGGSEVVDSGGTGTGERAAIFSAYWNDGARGCTVRSIPGPEKKDIDACTQRMSEIVDRCVIDAQRAAAGSAGSEYVSVTNDAGTIRICRMWMEFQGDWNNWIDACFDMDTGEVYYLYVSSKCISNAETYLDALPEGFNTQTAAEQIAEERGCELVKVVWSGKTGDTATAVFLDGGSAVCMELTCTYYQSSLLDVKLCCV